MYRYFLKFNYFRVYVLSHKSKVKTLKNFEYRSDPSRCALKEIISTVVWEGWVGNSQTY